MINSQQRNCFVGLLLSKKTMEPKRLSIFDLATMFEGDSVAKYPKSRVLVSTNRICYGNKSTLSKFVATAYDSYGRAVDSMNGYFLEPHTDCDSAMIENSKKAILGGNYQITPKQNNKQRYLWYLNGVKGRKGIAIHKGNHGTDSKGCLLPGVSYSYDKTNNEYHVWKSKEKLTELSNFFEKYGEGGIEINITPL